MPLELGPTSIVGREIDFSMPGTSKKPMMPDDMYDILGWLIRAHDSVRLWISRNGYRFDLQHKENMAAIDSEIDREVKEAGGLNTPMDASTSGGTITKEKNILVILYMAKEAEF